MTLINKWAIFRSARGRETVLGLYTSYDKARRHCDGLVDMVSNVLGDTAASYDVVPLTQYDISRRHPEWLNNDKYVQHVADITNQVEALSDFVDCSPAVYKMESTKFLEHKS
tara:strand:- start:158 stop:493 length:336 start_codon:yes stop_codon:yes gene_type:complete